MVEMSSIIFRLMAISIFKEYIILRDVVYKWDSMNDFPFLSGFSFAFDTSIVISHFGFCCIFRRCSKINIYQQPHLDIWCVKSVKNSQFRFQSILNVSLNFM